MARLSIIIPVLNEGDSLAPFLRALSPFKQHHVELVGVDGGSTDTSFAELQKHCDISIQTPAGRSTQMNAGAEHATGDVLLFLHADTYLPKQAINAIYNALQHAHWGRFDVRFDKTNPLLTLTAHLMNLRSRITRVATGDQALFFTRTLFNQLNGFADIPLMEDVDICKRARTLGQYAPLSYQVTTSSRRWRTHGTLKTIGLMWWLRWLYFIGVAPQKLHKTYYG